MSARVFPMAIMASAFVRAGLVEGRADPGAARVSCFICEETVARVEADYDYEFNLWECRECRARWR